MAGFKNSAFVFFHGDTRAASDFESLPAVDWLIDAAANPSVLAAVKSGLTSRQLFKHNLASILNRIYRLPESDEHEPVNIGNPHEITILKFAGRVRSLVGTTTPIVFRPLPQDDPKQRCPDITKARRILHREPKVNLEEGLRLTYEYFRQKVAHAELTREIRRPILTSRQAAKRINPGDR